MPPARPRSMPHLKLVPTLMAASLTAAGPVLIGSAAPASANAAYVSDCYFEPFSLGQFSNQALDYNSAAGAVGGPIIAGLAVLAMDVGDTPDLSGP